MINNEPTATGNACLQPTLAYNAVEVVMHCCCTEQLEAAAIASAVDLLSPEERARHDRLRFPADRRDFAVAHALLRNALATYTGRAPREWMFVTGPSGKPRLAPAGDAAPDISFNLTHTRGLVACALSLSNDVGIDAEPIDEGVDVLPAARHYFARHESRELESLTGFARAERFVEQWVLKEAYLKATGKGLSGRLDEVTFSLADPSPIQLASSDRREAACWRFALFAPSARHRLAIAVRSAHAAHYAPIAVKLSAVGVGERELLPLRSS